MSALDAVKACRDLSDLSEPAQQHLARFLEPVDLSEVHDLRLNDLVLVVDGSLTVKQPGYHPYRLGPGGLAGEWNVADWRDGKSPWIFQLQHWRAGSGRGYRVRRDRFDDCFGTRPELLDRVLEASDIALAAEDVRKALRRSRALGDAQYDVVRSLLEGARLETVKRDAPLGLVTGERNDGYVLLEGSAAIWDHGSEPWKATGPFVLGIEEALRAEPWRQRTKATTDCKLVRIPMERIDDLVVDPTVRPLLRHGLGVEQDLDGPAQKTRDVVLLLRTPEASRLGEHLLRWVAAVTAEAVQDTVEVITPATSDELRDKLARTEAQLVLVLPTEGFELHDRDAPLVDRVTWVQRHGQDPPSTRFTRRVPIGLLGPRHGVRGSALSGRALKLLGRHPSPGGWPLGTVRVRLEKEVEDLLAAGGDLADVPFAHRELLTAQLKRLARCFTGRKVGLALGGGGAFGYAQLALIRRLHDEGLPIDVIAGASIGATTGAYYAVRGKAGLDKVQRRARAIFVVGWAGVMSTALLGRMINEDLDHLGLHELDLPFFPVAVNSNSGLPIEIRSGSVGYGVRASCGLPPLQAARDGTRRFLDGGMSANVPVDVLRDEGCDLVIASNPVPFPSHAGSSLDVAALVRGLPKLWMQEAAAVAAEGARALLVWRTAGDLWRGLQTLMRSSGDLQAQQADVRFNAPDLGFSLFHFWRGEEIEQAARGTPELARTVSDAMRAWRQLLERRPREVAIDERTGLLRVNGELAPREEMEGRLFDELVWVLDRGLTTLGVHRYVLFEGALGPQGDGERLQRDLADAGLPISVIELRTAAGRADLHIRVDLGERQVDPAATWRHRLIEAGQAAKVHDRSLKPFVAGRAARMAIQELRFGDPEAGRLLAIQAASRHVDATTTRALRLALDNPAQLLWEEDVGGGTTLGAWSPCGRFFATLDDLSAQVRDACTGELLAAWQLDDEWAGWPPGGVAFNSRGDGLWVQPGVLGWLALATDGTWRDHGEAQRPVRDGPALQLLPDPPAALRSPDHRTLLDEDMGTLVLRDDDHEICKRLPKAPVARQWAWNRGGTGLIGIDDKGEVLRMTRGGQVRWRQQLPLERRKARLVAAGDRACVWVRGEKSWLVHTDGTRELAVDRVCCADFTDTGSHLAIGTRDGRLAVLAPDGTLEDRFVAHETEVSAVAWSPDHTLLASGDAHGHVFVWRHGERFSPLSSGGARVIALHWHGDALAVVSIDGLVRMWRLPAFERDDPRPGRAREVLGRGDWLLIRRGQTVQAFRGRDKAWTQQVGFGPMTLSDDGRVAVYTRKGVLTGDLDTGPTRPLEGDTAPLGTVALGPDGRVAWTSGTGVALGEGHHVELGLVADQLAFVDDLLVVHGHLPDDARARVDLAVTADGEIAWREEHDTRKPLAVGRLLARERDGRLQVLDPRTAEVLDEREHGPLFDLCWSPDRTLLAGRIRDDTLLVFRWSRGALDLRLEAEVDPEALAWSEEDRLLAVATPRDVLVYQDRRLVARIEAHATQLQWTRGRQLWALGPRGLSGHLVHPQAMIRVLRERVHRPDLDHATWLEAFGPDEPYRPLGGG